MNDAAPAQGIAAGEGYAGVARMTFTGRGDEYFRIWIVNLFLTLITLGIYSAWAKVRKTKYFWQNSRLDAAVFDFHGKPVAILKGRILALALLVAYSRSFEYSLAAGLVTIAVLLAAGPWLFVKAQQFKFGNTSFRGLRFGFVAAYRDGLRIVFPILVVWFSTTVVAASVGEEVGGFLGLLAVISVATFLLVPWMHHRLKWFQHERATYGDRRFAFEPATPAFYRTYAKGIGFVIAGALVGMIVMAVIIVALTLLTCGLYWPYAAVALARYRVECMRIDTDVPLSAIAAGVAAPPAGAVGDATADSFGLDIGL